MQCYVNVVVNDQALQHDQHPTETWLMMFLKYYGFNVGLLSLKLQSLLKIDMAFGCRFSVLGDSCQRSYY